MAVFLMVGLVSAQDTQPQGGTEVLEVMGTAFAYQGSLTDGGSPTDGDYDLRFRPCDAAEGGTLLGAVIPRAFP